MATPDEYVNKIVDKYQIQTGENSPVYTTALAFKSVAEGWAGACLRSVSVSGSYAKLTAVSSSLAGGSDIDLFVSLISNCTCLLGWARCISAAAIRRSGPSH